MSRNFVLVTGNLGNEIELKVFDNNKKVCNFSIAESYPTSKKDGNGKTIYETRWHQITAWDGLAQKMSDYAVKGQPIQASGYLDYDEFKKDNKDYRTAKIVANEVELYAKFDYLDRRNSKEQKAPIDEINWK
jgi:single-strand DNA-binding protein